MPPVANTRMPASAATIIVAATVVAPVSPRAAAIARVMDAKWALGLTGGLVVANPVPESFALPRERADDAIEQALREASARGVTGKALTPFLLSRVNTLTDGDSLASNRELVLNNARLAAEVAVAYAARAA